MKLSHDPIVDSCIQDSIQGLLTTINFGSLSLQRWQHQEYQERFQDWIYQSRYNKVIGLDLFPISAYSCGSLESIVSFVHRHCVNRRIRFSRAEFVGSKIAANHARAQWCFLEEQDISQSDAVILSFPFSGNGSIYPQYQEIIDRCDRLEVPVLIDACYYPISHGITLDVSAPCITDVVFSQSKSISVQMRLGLRFCKIDHDDIVQTNSNLGLFNRLGAFIGMNIMQEYSHDWFVNKYRPRHHEVCSQYQIEPTNTFTLAISQDPQYLRGGYNRVCITDEIVHD